MARFQLEVGPPLHHQVYLDLQAALESGEFRPGSRLPTERELAERYGCSLITIRHALGELVREGRIERTRGRGTFVRSPLIERNIAGVQSFAEEMQRRGLEPATRIITSRVERAGETTALALNLQAGAPVVFLERIRLGGGEPMILEQARLPAHRFPDLLAHDLEGRSLYDVLAAEFGARVVRARETVEPDPAARPRGRASPTIRGRWRCRSTGSPMRRTARRWRRRAASSAATAAATTSSARWRAPVGRTHPTRRSSRRPAWWAAVPTASRCMGERRRAEDDALTVGCPEFQSV